MATTAPPRSDDAPASRRKPTETEEPVGETRRRPPTVRPVSARWPRLAWPLGLTVVASVYLFATAPPPLPAAGAAEPGATIAIERVFELLNEENRLVRALWTTEIVSPGPAVGLRFDEAWRDPAIEAGPLPALFLRETARELERRGLGLALFLGSDYPIAAANRFAGGQVDRLAALRSGAGPQHFFEPSLGRHTAMFADLAVADACVTCHNEHPTSPKRDWQKGDVMGATTWMYPRPKLSSDEALRLVGALRASIRVAYQHYLDEAATFKEPPEVGTRWPREGRYLPSADVFMAEHARRAAPTLEALVAAGAEPTPSDPARATP
ncbi:MAG: DUF3365 domain-containing protein [Kofleriaceae bacterium]|nr:DUF3365 domain-containing protein [Kofleriaceae bacterium]MBP9170013.1 DUF3365 domain-containing protein [Kofleriaceae bacterium]MBP9861693.1 DUF3365 domain-containing protein [Kofleriaceae bacterium]